MSTALKLRQEALQRKKALESKRLRMSFTEKIKELEEIVEWVDPKNWGKKRSPDA